MRDQAIPMGVAYPDESYGFGRITLPPQSLGWDCSPTALPEAVTCATACGSVGSRTCQSGCTWSDCAAPVESCNGLDDDCDGSTDEGLPSCTAGTDAAGSSDAADGARSEPDSALIEFDAAADSGPPAGPVAGRTTDDGGCSSGTTGAGPWRACGIAAIAVGSVLILRRRERHDS
jgi:hypothetical protein